MQDLQALALVSLVSSFGFCFAMIALFRLVPSEQSLRHWIVVATLLAVAQTAFTLDSLAHHLWTISIAGVTAAFAVSYQLVATRALFGLRQFWPIHWLAAGVMLVIFLALSDPSQLALRNSLFGLILMPFDAICGWLFWRNRLSRARSPERAIALLYAGFVLFHVLELSGNPLMPAWLARASAPAVLEAFRSSYLLLFNIGLSILLTLMISAGLQRQLVEALTRAEEAGRWRSDFLANMSHEIRTPMNAIIGLSHLALRTEIVGQSRSYVEKIHNAGNSLLRIINDILDFSKIDAGRLALEQIDFDLEGLMQDLSSTLGIAMAEKQLEFLLAIDQMVPTGLVGDPYRLNQVLLNLCGNAIKFTNHGEINIAVEALHADSQRVVLRFAISDTGIGLDEAQQKSLFQAFTQAERGTTRQFGGTGLGLAISKQLVEMMRGEIGVISEPGRGSTFWFILPFGRSRTIRPANRADSARLSQLRILLVDDNPNSRTILGKHLDSFGCVYHEVASGAEALDEIRLAAQPFDLILLDWRMPGMDGIETARRLRDAAVGGVTPQVIMVSAYDRDEVMQRSGDLDIAGYLVKPVSATILVDAIMAALDRRLGDAMTDAVPATEPAPVADWRGTHVLVAEDDELNQLLAREVLEQAGFTVTMVSDGRAAFVAATTQKFDAILLDVQMPVMDGFEATRAIRADPRSRKVPIIAMTANAIVGDREYALGEGMDDYITKPLDLDILFAVLGKWLKKPATPEPVAVSPQRSIAAARPSGEIDLAAAARRTGDNQDLLDRVHRRFIQSLRDLAPELQRCVREQQHAEASRLVHTLKGIAGTAGAWRVQAAAEELERAFRQDDIGFDAELATLLRAMELAGLALSAMMENQTAE